jgi:hypothetical protein
LEVAKTAACVRTPRIIRAIAIVIDVVRLSAIYFLLNNRELR